MDPDETLLDPSSNEHLSRQPTDWPLTSPTTPTEDSDSKRLTRHQSLRIRPTEYLENADPPSPLNVSTKSSAVSTASKMSLFHLFSRPKVERQRGYAEKSVDVLPSHRAKAAAASTPNLVVHVRPPTNGEPPPTPISLHSDRSKPSPRVKWKEPLPRDPAERRNGVFEPPPLFQAYPQSVKEGILEVSDMSPEAVLHKAKGKKSKGDVNVVGEDGQSYKTKRSARSGFKHVANGNSVDVDMPRKVFVLVTSGYLLQYAESGPSDRLPEKVLHLGKESAAFACDLLPGKHYVLQVSQAVDQEGVVVATSSSIFSKLGIRSATAKKTTSGFLLVMPSGREMESWMSAIRQEIEHLGGKKIRPDTAVRPKTGDTGTDLKKTPSQSHRYQVKRNPSKIELVSLPGASAVSSPTQTAFQIPSPTQSTFLVPSPTIGTFPPSPSRSPKIEEEREDGSDTATIDGIDMEASKLEEGGPKPSPRKRAPSDAPSISSSAVVSVEHQQLSNIRNSFSNSTRTSNTSQAGTVITTAGTSRTNSLVGSPPSPGFLAGTLESARDNVAPLKQPYRPMASAGYGASRRRSAVPLATSNGVAISPLNTSPPKQRQSALIESPVTGQQFPSPPRAVSTPSRLPTSYSEPNIKGLASAMERHDSKMATPPPMATLTEDEPPESFVGDLPDPSTWSSARAPGKRTSSLMPPPATQVALPPAEAPRAIEPIRSKRMSFSMPLKVNPSTPNSGSPPVANNRRRSQLGTPDAAGEQPIVHTLTAKVDSSANRVSISQFQTSPSLPAQYGGVIVPKRASVSQFNQPASFSTPSGLQRTPSGTPNPRLSLFPSAVSLPAGLPPQPPKRCSSAAAHTSYVQPNSHTLRRPTSMQVRSDHAPFLQSVRNSTGPLDGRTVPIRGMRPSRSASNVAQLAAQTPSPGPAFSSFNGLRFDTPTLAEESDKATPLPDMDRAISPLPTSRPGSRSGSRKGVKTRSSLPSLDLGIPIVGLGPPAPPPSTPLPAPPPGSRNAAPSPAPTMSRTTSPSPAPIDAANVHLTSGIDSVAGLGIRVS